MCFVCLVCSTLEHTSFKEDNYLLVIDVRVLIGIDVIRVQGRHCRLSLMLGNSSLH